MSRAAATRWPTTWRSAARWVTSSRAPEKLLGQFLDYLDEHGERTVTIEHALAWATLPASGDSELVGLPAVGACAASPRYLHALDPAHEVPPPICCPTRAAARDPVPLLRRARSRR